MAWRSFAVWTIGFLTIAAGVAYRSYSSDMRTTREQRAAGSRVVPTRHGSLEYALWGEGPPVLVVHGAGGGYDQGVLIARAFGGDGFRWIAPSRFGYLRTPLPADASTAAQADAFADLLDTLGIERVGLLAMSGGVPPSLQFALRHPERTSALVLLSSAPYTPLTVADQRLPVPIGVYQALFRSNGPYWILQHVARGPLETMFDVTPALRARLSGEERQMVSDMVDSFQPVIGRVPGLGNEGAAIDSRARYPLEEIRTPTLVVHAADDHINPFHIGEYTARHVRGARFLAVPTGGHLLLGYQAEVRAGASAFLRQHAAVEAHRLDGTSSRAATPK